MSPPVAPNTSSSQRPGGVRLSGSYTGRRGWSRRPAAVLTALICLVSLAGSWGVGVAEASTTSAAGHHGFSAAEIAKIDTAARASLVNGITGAVVSISDPHRGTYLKAYGYSDTAGTPMTTKMHYRIASVTKTFTADAVLRLVDQKKVRLTDPISKYVSDLPNGDQITVRDLLAMRSGVYDFGNDAAFLARYLADPTLPGWRTEDTVAIIRAHAKDFTPPNQKTVYSNSNFVLLGYVIEKGSGQPASQYLNALARRLHLTHTTYPSGDTLPRPFTRGYLGDGVSPGPYRDVTVSNPVVPGTAGALISTVPDMTRYAKELGTGVGLSPATAKLRQDWTPLTSTGVRLQYGLGIIQIGDWVGHDGALFGYSNMVFYLPQQQATVVVMNNESDEQAVTAQALWGDIVKQLYPGSLPSWP